MKKSILSIFILAFFSVFITGGIAPVKSSAASQKAVNCVSPESGGTWQDSTGDNSKCICPDGKSVDSAGACVDDSTDTGAIPFETDEGGSKIKAYLQNGINLLTALAGLAITASVIIGGIQYSTSGGNPTASAAAKKRIGNAFLALLALVFLYTFLQWIVPGGIFGQ